MFKVFIFGNMWGGSVGVLLARKSGRLECDEDGEWMDGWMDGWIDRS